MCGLTDLLYDKHRRYLDCEDWQMESYRELLVAAWLMFLCLLQEAALVTRDCQMPWVRAGFSLALQGAAALPCCPKCCLLLSVPSSLFRGQKAPQCSKVNKYVHFHFLNLIFKMSQRRKLPNRDMLYVAGCAASPMCWTGSGRKRGLQDLIRAWKPDDTDKPFKTYF